MEYFILPISWNKGTLYLLYFSNDDDGLVLTPDQRIIVAASRAEAEALAKKRYLKLQDPMETLELGVIQSWVSSRSMRLPEANLLYRVWNFFGDVATSLKKADHYLGYDEQFISLHDELFWGCNMPGLTQSQELYEIDLSQSEIRNLRSILRSGLEIFQQGLPG
ncbi:hypothetical protein IV102_23905 [bacterium]|nr:hypothetical protein [bacterium]